MPDLRKAVKAEITDEHTAGLTIIYIRKAIRAALEFNDMRDITMRRGWRYYLFLCWLIKHRWRFLDDELQHYGMGAEKCGEFICVRCRTEGSAVQRRGNTKHGPKLYDSMRIFYSETDRAWEHKARTVGPEIVESAVQH